MTDKSITDGPGTHTVAIRDTPTAVATRSEGGYLSQFSDMLEFLSHQKIFYKTCMRAVKVAMNFQMILKRWTGPPFDRPSSLSTLDRGIRSRWGSLTDSA